MGTFLSRHVLLALLGGVLCVGCAAPSKDSRVDVVPLAKGGNDPDSGGRATAQRGGSSSPRAGQVSAEPPALAGGAPQNVERAPGAAGVQDTAQGPTTPPLLGAGKCSLPEAERPQHYCGPYSPERRALCYAFSSNKDLCVDLSPADGWAKDFHDRLGERLREHTAAGVHQRRSAPSSCSSGRLVSALPGVRLMAEPSETAAVTVENVASPSGTAVSVSVLEVWGYWARVRVSGREGWAATKAIDCL